MTTLVFEQEKKWMWLGAVKVLEERSQMWEARNIAPIICMGNLQEHDRIWVGKSHNESLATEGSDFGQ